MLGIEELAKASARCHPLRGSFCLLAGLPELGGLLGGPLLARQPRKKEGGREEKKINKPLGWRRAGGRE